MRQSPHELSAVVEILFLSGMIIPTSQEEEGGRAGVNKHRDSERPGQFTYMGLIVSAIIAEVVAVRRDTVDDGVPFFSVFARFIYHSCAD